MSNFKIESFDGMMMVNDIKAKHTYDIETDIGGERAHIYVDANTRTQATKRLRDLGCKVRSVAMEG